MVSRWFLDINIEDILPFILQLSLQGNSYLGTHRCSRLNFDESYIELEKAESHIPKTFFLEKHGILP